MRIGFLGNWGPPHSTENHLALSLASIGHEVIKFQEGEVPACDIPGRLDEQECELFWWVQTYGLAETGGTCEERHMMVEGVRAMGIPSVGYHLDLWWGLDRVEQIEREAFFCVDYLFTADGGHDKEWKKAGINHHWLPPGVYHGEAYDGTPRREFMSDVAFVGSWRSYAHTEHWKVREEMLNVLRRKYGRRFQCWPKRQAIRGTDLTDLYASVKVVVGDSCLAGKFPRYWSDRVPETMGRGGLLVHPYIEGIEETHPFLITYPAQNWDLMLVQIDSLLDNEPEADVLRRHQASDTREHHTYRTRMQQVLEIVYG